MSVEIQERINKFLSGELNWSIATERAKEIEPLIKRLTDGYYFIKTQKNDKYTHFYCKCIPHWELRDSDIRQLKKIEKQLIKEELLKQKEEIEKKLELL